MMVFFLAFASIIIISQAQEDLDIDTVKDFKQKKTVSDIDTVKDFKLKKTVFSNQTRLLIVAGLEGTGHHAMNAMFEVCNRRKPPLCEPDKVLSSKLMLYDPPKRLVHGLFGAADTAESLRMANGIKAYLNGLREKPGNHLFYVGLEAKVGNGMFSYPNFNGIYKSLDHPDIYQLGLLAEQAGIDYRVLVIQRNSNAILKSVDRRDFGRANEEPKILIDNAAVLHTQLTLLDRRFYHCLDYEDFASIRSSPELKANLIRFLHPKQMVNILDQMLKVIKPSKNDPDDPKFILNDSVVIRDAKHQSTQEYLAFQLQARMSLIDNLCRSRP